MDIRHHLFEILKESIVCFGLALLLPLFVFYTTGLFIKSFPQPQSYSIPNYAQRIQQTESEEEKKNLYTHQMQLRNAYIKHVEEHSQAFFFFSLFMGICAIIAGMFICGMGVGSGLILGGILTIFQGYYFYWFYLTEALRFLSLLVGLIILFGVGHIKSVKRISNHH
ncbi:hypothetical protein JST56_07575 [Candidatus Dependentiae bacterium]|jgi:hypothetical protein|nr:hypothetical protein [Candidatus Dependentiae bacterium]